MKTKTIINHNNKLNCDAFVHIAEEPTGTILESHLPMRYRIEEQQIASSGSAIDMLDDDGAGTAEPLCFEAEMVGFIRFKANELPSMLVYLSHGMSVEQFREQHKASGITNDLAVYTYLKIK